MTYNNSSSLAAERDAKHLRHFPFQSIVVGILLLATITTIVATVWLVWPLYQDYRLAERLRRMPSDYNSLEFHRSLEKLIEKNQGGSYVIAMLGEGTRAPDVAIRRRCTSALGKYAALRQELYPELIEALADEDKYVRMQVWKELEPVTRLLIPRLLTALSSPNPRLRAGALEALGSLRGSEAISAIPSITTLLSDNDPLVREYAVWAIGSITPANGDTAELLAKALNDSALAVRREALRALGRHPLVDPTPLINSVLSDDMEISQNAWYVIHKQSKHVEQAVPALIAALRDPRHHVRLNAICALGRTRADGSEAVPSLLEVLHDDNPTVRFLAARSIWQITGDCRDVLPTLIETVRHVEDLWSLAGFHTLGDIGSAAADAVPALVEIVRIPVGPSSGHRIHAVQAMKRIASQPEIVVPVLIDLLDDPDWQLSEQAIEALMAFGPDANAALPALQRLTTRMDIGSLAESAIKVIEQKGK
jgi:HEAT repeat protein